MCLAKRPQWSDPVITFIANLKVRPANGPAFEALMTRVRDLTRANEPGVAYYDFGKSADDPDTYFVVEVYRDASAHASHMETVWVKDSIPESRRLVEGAFDIKQYTSPGVAPVVRRMKEIDVDARNATTA
jgi:quinol monooxygenase YgiN